MPDCTGLVISPTRPPVVRLRHWLDTSHQLVDDAWTYRYTYNNTSRHSTSSKLARMCHPDFLSCRPSLSSMASSFPEYGCEDSYSLPPRSRAGSRVSATAAQFANIQLADSPRTLPLESSPSARSEALHSSGYISPNPPNSATFLSTSNSQGYAPFPLLPPEILNAEWNEHELHQTSDSTPLVTVDSVQDYSSHQSSPPLRLGASMRCAPSIVPLSSINAA